VTNLSLRAKVTVAFGVGAALVSAVLAGATFAIVDHYLLGQQEQSAAHLTFSDARVVRRDLARGGPDLGVVLASLSVPQATSAYLYQDGRWYSGAFTFGYGTQGSRPLGVPRALVIMVNGGVPARQRVVVQGEPAVTVGVPLAAVAADFFEVHSLSELSSTLDVLAWVLAGCAAATTLGGVLLGRWASGRLVRPLGDVANVAAAIAGGALERRLPPGGGPELSRLSASFNDMVGALEERIKRDARFASDVSHELRSPLTTIQAGIELLQADKESLPADAQQALELLSAEVSRFSVMVQDLLEMSRYDAGAAPLDIEELALDELVESAVSAYAGCSVPVIVELPAKELWLLADRRRLQRVLVNLLDNAAAHGGGAVAVRVARQGDEALVAVEDAGPGVAPAERAAIFERFYRGAAAGRRGEDNGTGLGLALVAEHVKAQGGLVEVTDRPGGGARFVVRLPLRAPRPGSAEPAVPRAPAPSTPWQPAPPAPGGRAARPAAAGAKEPK
jgi:two-component system sensor histidine kinase MtrB